MEPLVDEEEKVHYIHSMNFGTYVIFVIWLTPAPCSADTKTHTIKFQIFRHQKTPGTNIRYTGSPLEKTASSPIIKSHPWAVSAASQFNVWILSRLCAQNTSDPFNHQFAKGVFFHRPPSFRTNVCRDKNHGPFGEQYSIFKQLFLSFGQLVDVLTRGYASSYDNCCIFNLVA